ncbi:hypothetical protein BCR44DRAFT_1455584 [Catenaria anguillulae PL171]|uniref:Uncharacterized protein n=1 Tax=Catenaria anguillulae PL171 TaxID=765915 RepID=A0A1Y2H0M6_9FUNG|nr:hypothetical protein BCR44DRAFT_1455584 [Catenaria anguillulae PL171]
MSGHDEFDLSIYDDEYLYGDSGPRSPTGVTSRSAAAAAASARPHMRGSRINITNAAQKRPHPDSDSETDARPAKVPATSANVEHAGDVLSGYGDSQAVAPASSAPQEQYWTSDRDVIDVVTMVTKDQACVKDITFKSTSSVYVQFTTPDMAAAAKVGFENIEIDQRMPVVRFADPHFNPFRQQQHHQAAEGGQGGGYRPPFNNNNNNMNPNQGPMGGGGGFGGGQGMVRPPPGGQFQQRPPQGMGGYGNAPPSGPYGGGPGGPGMGMGMGGQYHQRPPHQGFPNRPPHLPPPPAQLPPPPGQGGYYGRPPHQQQQQPQQGGFGGMNGGDRRGSGVGQY